MYNLYDFTLEKLQSLMVEYFQKPFRARQLFKWIYEKRETNFDNMSDISLSFREILKSDFVCQLPKIFVKQESSDGTIKLLLNLEDDSKVETVLMRYSYGNVLCVTSQVGCNMGCSFCASGLLKKKRDLLPEEMVGQVLVMNDLLRAEGSEKLITHIVVMGTGEPFDNYENVIDFVRIMNHPKAFAIGARHITVSTCGIPDKIRQYAREGLQINLAISLHAPNNEIRSKIMKINRAYPLEELIPAVAEYNEIASRRVTYEYILLAGINDSLEHADELATLIKPTFAYVNLIPYNPVIENGYKRSSDKAVHAFLDRLTKRGVTATVRKEFGTDIDAACGQLRAKHEKK
jgi:23S rRNA (adenine2503-C2)-methyltransferase